MIVRVLFMLLAFAAYVPAANACSDAMRTLQVATRVDTAFGSLADSAMAEDLRATGDQRCECPVLASAVAAPLVDPEKAHAAVPPADGMFELILAGQRTLSGACEMQLSAAAAPRVYPLYLLTARLRR